MEKIGRMRAKRREGMRSEGIIIYFRFALFLFHSLACFLSLSHILVQTLTLSPTLFLSSGLARVRFLLSSSTQPSRISSAFMCGALSGNCKSWVDKQRCDILNFFKRSVSYLVAHRRKYKIVDVKNKYTPRPLDLFHFFFSPLPPLISFLPLSLAHKSTHAHDRTHTHFISLSLSRTHALSLALSLSLVHHLLSPIYLAFSRQRLGYNIETFLFVIDAKGWSLRLATQDAFRYLKGNCEAKGRQKHLGIGVGEMLLN